MVAVIGVDAELVDDFEVVFAPVADVDEGVRKRGSIVAGEVAFLPEDAGGGEYVGSNEFVEKALKFGVSQADAI